MTNVYPLTPPDPGPRCPHCGSDNCRTAAAVYAAGTQTINTKNRGIGVGVAGGRLGVGIMGGRSRGTAVSLEAQNAAPARTRFLTFGQGFLLFVAFLVGLLIMHAHWAFELAFVFTAWIAGSVPIVTGVQAQTANLDYDRKWLCQACGWSWLR